MISNQNKKISWFKKVFDWRYFPYDFIKWTGAISVIFYLRLKRLYLNGKKPKKLFKGQYVIISNHSTYVDPLIICNSVWYRRIVFVATDILFKNKFQRIWFKAFGCIPINKENIAVASFKKIKNELARGHCVALFPEGNLNNQEQLKEFKAGSVMIALMADVPILPIYIAKRDKWWHRQKIMIGNKIDLKNYYQGLYPTMNEIQLMTEELQKTENKLKEEFLIRKKRKKQ